MDKLTNMALFVAIVDNNGLAAAAKSLNTSPATVSTKLKALEDYYGIRLLNRTTRTLNLTDEGEKFYQLSRTTLASVQDMENQILYKQAALSGNLRISAPRDLGKNMVAPMLERFLAINPDITPHLILTDEVLPVHDARLDVAFRYGHLEDSQLISRQLCSSRRVLCASPQYIKRFGQPKTPEDLQHHRCLGFLRAGEQLTRWSFHRNDKKTHLTISPSRLSNDGEMVKTWVLQGHGIAFKSLVDIAAEIKSGQLVIVLENYLQDFVSDVTDRSDLHLIYPDRHYIPARTRAFIDFTLEHFRKIYQPDLSLDTKSL